MPAWAAGPTLDELRSSLPTVGTARSTFEIRVRLMPRPTYGRMVESGAKLYLAVRTGGRCLNVPMSVGPPSALFSTVTVCDCG